MSDIQGAVRILASKETILSQSVETVNKLKEKHPPPHVNSQIPPDPVHEDSCFICDKENY